MKTRIVIWQLPVSNPKWLRGVSWLPEGSKFDLYDYVRVWTEDLEEDKFEDNLQYCEFLFHKFNLNRPDHFAGHSLSVSDVIQFEHFDENEINKNYSGELYFCDDIGFRKMELK